MPISLLVVSLAVATPEAHHFSRLDDVAVSVDGGLSRGVAWGDFDRDGLPDLVVANTIEQPEALYRNEGGDRFRQLHETPVTLAGGYHEGVQWIDFDNDGDLDLFVASTESGSRLYRNDGEGGLQPVDGAPLTVADGASEGCWSDYDGDGFLDVFLARRGGADSLLFRNLEGGGFRSVDGPWTGNGGDARACAWGDADGDGDPDLYVANFLDRSGGEPSKHRNYFYRNDGPAGFRELQGQEFVAREALSYGLSWVDYDDDEDLDLFVTNISSSDSNWLLENDGNGEFRLRKDLAVVADSRGPSKGHVWGDFDNDGDLDLFVANGTENVESVSEFDVYNFLYLRRGDGFERIEAGPVTRDRTVSAGAAHADFDRDGDLDLYVANWGDSDEDNSLYRNDAAGGHWLSLALVGTVSNRDAIGAMVLVETIDARSGGKRIQTRAHLPRQGYGSQNEPRVHFGLGGARQVEWLEIRWPSGRVDRHGPLAADRFLVATEGGAIAVDVAAQRHVASLRPTDAPQPLTGLAIRRYADWSPGGERLVFDANLDGTFQIYRRSLGADAKAIQLTQTGRDNRTPKWSPDGSRIVFQSGRDGNAEIYTMDASGGALRNLTDDPGGDSHPVWSADGRWIVFNSNRTGNEEIYRMRPDGSGLEPLTDFDEVDTYPAISPDGRRIAWRRVTPEGGWSRSGRNSEIFVMNTGGSDAVNVSRHPAFDGWPDWSPDGRHIVFASDRDARGGYRRFSLYVMDADGANVRRLTHRQGVQDTQPSWSTDGRIAFTRRHGDSSQVLIFRLRSPR